jgi:methionyl-tRNA formyltransferase
MKSSKKWVALFGGAGREGCLQRLIAESVYLKAVIIPAIRSSKLDQSLANLGPLPCEIIEVKKSNLANVLARFSGSAMLSIGFPYLIDAKFIDLFDTAINVHPTLLPKYRGPTSGAYILLNNECETGSTVHHMTLQMDRGDILCQSRVKLSPFDTIRSMQRKVYAEEPNLLISALEALESDFKPWPQNESNSSEYPNKRTPEDSELDPNKKLVDLIDHIRACDVDEYPAFFIYHGQKVCIKLWRPVKDLSIADEL